jgi:hypothetical protein
MDWEITEEISPSNVLAKSRRTRAIPVKGELQKESISVKVKLRTGPKTRRLIQVGDCDTARTGTTWYDL